MAKTMALKARAKKAPITPAPAPQKGADPHAKVIALVDRDPTMKQPMDAFLTYAILGLTVIMIDLDAKTVGAFEEVEYGRKRYRVEKRRKHVTVTKLQG